VRSLGYWISDDSILRSTQVVITRQPFSYLKRQVGKEDNSTESGVMLLMQKGAIARKPKILSLTILTIV